MKSNSQSCILKAPIPCIFTFEFSQNLENGGTYFENCVVHTDMKSTLEIDA